MFVCLLLTSLGGCSSGDKIEVQEALLAEDVLFRPNHGDAVRLDAVQSAKVKTIVEGFGDQSRVEVWGGGMGFKYGDFMLGNRAFSWQGGFLYVEKDKKWYVVRDKALNKMTEAYMKLRGQPPLRDLTGSEWMEVLSCLRESPGRLTPDN
jgi:hypothetical protein